MPIKHSRHKTNFAALIILSILWTPITIAEPAGIIAYVSSSIDNKQIRLINPDGSQDRLLWKVPISAGAGDRIGSLSWHPEGTELAFDSGHNWQRSMAIRNIYAISSDGARLRKITTPPGVEGSSNKPTGTVKFWVRGTAEQGDVQIYVEGASEPMKYFAKEAYDYQVTLTVADFGEGIRQYIRLWDPDEYFSSCRFSEEGWVDIIPGQEVDLGSVPFDFDLDKGCFRFHSPTWSYDGNHLLHMLGFGHSSIKNRTLKINSHAKFGHGKDILATAQVNHVKFAPTSSRKNEALYAVNGDAYDWVYLVNTENGAAPEEMIGAVMPGSSGSFSTNSVLDIAWLPDGSGFITAQTGKLPYNEGIARYGAIYLYTFAEKALSLIAYLPNESIGKLAVSPDGASIVFERGQESPYFNTFYREAPCRPCSIWMVNMDGSGLHQLVEDGRAPTWGKIALPVDYSRGDANGDGNINIQDVILSINIILDNGSPIKGSDCNKDGFMNIQDIVCTINQVLGNQPSA